MIPNKHGLERKRVFRHRLKAHNKKAIADTLECCIGNNLSPAEVSRLLNLPLPTGAGLLSSYWFYKRPNDSVTVTLKSNV